MRASPGPCRWGPTTSSPTGPQSRGYRGEQIGLKIGSGNIFREYSTVHRGTVDGGGMTVLGDNNLMMITSHLGHDSRVGDGCTLVNNALVAGHVRLDDGCILSGNSAIQQRVRVGRLALLGGLGSSTKDIPPFMIQQGYNCVSGLNLVGLRRSGMAGFSINALKVAFRVLFKEGRTQCAAIERIGPDLGDVAEVAELVAFLRASKLVVSTARGEERARLSDS